MRRETHAKARRREREARAANIIHEPELPGMPTASLSQSPLARLSGWFGSLLGPADHPRPVRVKPGPPIPAAPSPKTPVRAMHDDAAIAHRVKAIVAGIDAWAAKRRRRLHGRLSRRRATLEYRKWRADRAETAEKAAAANVKAYEGTVKPENRHKLERRRGMYRLIPIPLVLADTLIMERPWTLWGGSFTNSKIETVLLSYLRAFLIAFALVFSLRLAGSKLRQAIVEVAGRRGEKVAHALTIAMAGVALAGAYLLATAAAKLQGTTFAILDGATSTTITDGTFKAIVFFLIATSFASGYFASAPEAEDADRVRHPLRKANHRAEQERRRLARIDGRVKALEVSAREFDVRVTALKREQLQVGLEEIAKGQGARHELIGIEAHDDPIQLLKDELEQLGDGRYAGQPGKNGGPQGDAAKRHQRSRQAVQQTVTGAGKGGGHA